MLNPDGVIIGNSTVNLGGLDMDRKWVENNAEITPEIHYFQEYLKTLGKRNLMLLDL